MPLFLHLFSFIQYVTEQGRSHHTQLLLDKAWAGGRYELNQWFSGDYITKLWAAWLVF
jgi:hypothetical protein